MSIHLSAHFQCNTSWFSYHCNFCCNDFQFFRIKTPINIIFHNLVWTYLSFSSSMSKIWENHSSEFFVTSTSIQYHEIWYHGCFIIIIIIILLSLLFDSPLYWSLTGIEIWIFTEKRLKTHFLALLPIVKVLLVCCIF